MSEQAQKPEAVKTVADSLPLPDATRTADEAGAGTQWPTMAGYEILGELGRGGMGVVYKARQRSLGRIVALKMILAGAHAGPQELDRFRSEAEAVARLQHPNIVQIYEVGEQDGRSYFSLELLDGGSLSQQIAGTPQSAHHAAALAETLARAIHVAHERGIVHRDLTPGNVLLSLNGTPKITDFGLAKRLDLQEASQTQTGSILGTPSYMAPEQAAGKTKEVGPATDVYALGALLYELLTGRPPFRGESMLDTLQQVMSTEPVPPSRLQPKVPRDLETICLKGLQKERRKRYASAAEMADDLQRFLTGQPIHARPVGAWERSVKWARRRPATAGLLAVSVLAVLSLLGVSVGYNAKVSAVNAQLEQTAEREREQAQEARKQTELARLSNAQLEITAQRERAQAQEAKKQTERARLSLYELQLSQVAVVWDRDPGHGLDLLRDTERCPPRLRDFAWRYYRRLCRRAHPPLLGHKKWVLCVAFSPDGSTLATGDEDGVVKLWDAATGKERASFKAHGFGVSCLVFAADGQTLATGGGDNTARLWDVATRKERVTLQGHKDPVWCVALSPDGKTAATGSIDETVRLWDVATGKEQANLWGKVGWLNALAFSPDGTKLAWSGWSETVKLWEVGSKKDPVSLSDHAHWVWCVAFAPDGKTLATASEDKTVRLWDLTAATPKSSPPLTGHTGGVLSAVFASDGKTLVTASGDQTVKLWGIARLRERLTLEVSEGADFFIPLLRDYAAVGQERSLLKGYTRPGYAVAVSPNGKTLATGAWTGAVTLWDAVKTQEQATLLGHTDLVRSVAFSPDGKTLASASWDRTVKLWQPSAEKPYATLKGHRHWVWSAAFSPDGKTIASGGEDGKVRVWDVVANKYSAELEGHTGAVYSVAFSPDGKTLASAGWEVRLWDLATRQPSEPLKGHTHLIRSVAFSPDGKTLATGSFDTTVKLWDVAARKERALLAGHKHWVWSVAFSPDGKTIASASGDTTVRLWDVAGGELLHTLTGHMGGIRSVAFTRDGKTLATAGEDMTIRLWDPVLGQDPRAILKGHTAEVTCVVFAPDDTVLASAGADGTVKLWDATPEQEREK